MFCRYNRGAGIITVTEFQSLSGILHCSAKQKVKKKSTQDILLLERDRICAKPVRTTAYLELNRQISNKTLMNDLFRDKIFKDKYNNVCFPHYNKLGFSGFEKKNKRFNGFSEGGKRGLWFSNKPQECNKIIICESAIDALSYYELKKEKNAQYISIGGQLSYEQLDLIKVVLEKNKDKEIILAVDNDKQGEKYIEKIKEVAKEVKHDNVIVDIPENKKDWNDELKCQKMQKMDEHIHIFESRLRI